MVNGGIVDIRGGSRIVVSLGGEFVLSPPVGRAVSAGMRRDPGWSCPVGGAVMDASHTSLLEAWHLCHLVLPPHHHWSPTSQHSGFPSPGPHLPGCPIAGPVPRTRLSACWRLSLIPKPRAAPPLRHEAGRRRGPRRPRRCGRSDSQWEQAMSQAGREQDKERSSSVCGVPAEQRPGCRTPVGGCRTAVGGCSTRRLYCSYYCRFKIGFSATLRPKTA